MIATALSLAVTIFGAFTLGLFVARLRENAQSRYIGLPVAAMLLILAFLHLRPQAAVAHPSPADAVPEALARVLWGSLGALWVFLADRLDDPMEKKKLSSWTIPIMAVNLGAALASVLPVPGSAGFLEGSQRAVSTVSLYYSGFRVLRRMVGGASSPEAFRAFSRIIFLTMIARPVVLFTEISGFQYPGLDADRPFWEQAYPLYGLLVFALSLPALPRGRINAERTDGGERLTDRERRVIELLRRGRSYKAIASELDIGVPTVKSHATNAYRKLGIRNRKELYSRYPS